MNYTEPIKSKKMLRNVLMYLKNNDERNFMMVFTAIHTGLRASDLLKLRVRDVKDRSHINIVEGKTGKSKRIIINKELKQELKKYCKGKEHYEFLFASREGANNPISRVRAYQILKDVGEVFGVHISCHVLRKTFGYMHYKQNNNVVALMEIFNHSSPTITLRYIGIAQSDLDLTMNDMSFL